MKKKVGDFMVAKVLTKDMYAMEDVLRDYNVTVDLKKNEDPLLTQEEFDNLKKEAEALVEKYRNQFGHYDVTIRPMNKRSVIIDFFSFEDAHNNEDTVVKGRAIPNVGKIQLSVCDICEQRLACLVYDEYAIDGKCAEDSQVRKGITSQVLKEYNLSYPSERIREILKSEGFNHLNLGDIALESAFERNNIQIYLN